MRSMKLISCYFIDCFRTKFKIDRGGKHWKMRGCGEETLEEEVDMEEKHYQEKMVVGEEVGRQSEACR